VTRQARRVSALRLSLYDRFICDGSWPAASIDHPAVSDVSIPFRVAYGEHTLTLENPSGPDWVELGGINLGIQVPALVAVARHGPQGSLLWVRHRTQLLSPAPDDELIATAATLQLEDYPAGTWEINWWDPQQAEVHRTDQISHPGGLLVLPTPLISRHAAAWISRPE